MPPKKSLPTLAPQWVPTVAITVGVLAGMPATAQEKTATQLEKITAVSENYKTDSVNHSKFDQPLLDTPQSIQVIPKKVLEEQGVQTLQEVLRNVPGVAFTMGEGGAGWGDMFNIRGFSAEQSVTVDETRESALSTRTDTFNLEDVTVFKGTGSFETGVAAVGGSINLSSKKPKLDNFNHIHLGVGTDNYQRATADINHKITDSIAFRLNVMGHKNNVAGRGPTEFKRWGVAPSITFGLGTPTRLNLSYFYQKDENIPDFGLPVSAYTGKRMNGVDWDFWAGNKNFDSEETKTQRFSAKLEHDFSDNVRVSNTFSWSRVDRFRTYATGGRLLNVGKIKATGYQKGKFNTSDYWGYASTTETYPSGYLATARIPSIASQYRGETYANQTNLNIKFNTGSVQHNMLVGAEWYQETYRNRPYSRTLPDTSKGRMVIDVRNPTDYWSGPTKLNVGTSKAGTEVQDIGLFVYDNIKLSPQWEIDAGLRMDRYHAKWYAADGSRAVDSKGRAITQKETVWSGRLGLVYKPVENGSIYLSYSQATQPSAAGAASRSGGGNDYSPTKAKTWELGTKWDLFNNNLAVTAAIFQTERSNSTDTDPDNPDKIVQHATKERVRGLELSAAGNITDRWSAYAGFTYLNGKVIRNQENPLNEGGRLKNVPKYAFNLWTTYAFTEALNASVGVQYVGKRQFSAGNFTNKGFDLTAQAPAYFVVDAAVSYRVNKNVDLRLNVNNVFNKKYFAKVSTSRDGFQKFAIPGSGRTFILSTDIKF
ncbi:TonB-dependent receptor [Pelistega europaea]|uniref:TonB-dependent siderophore receptor n=1 Tax=Pelistega europaea TaxID=106147 RepID=A0A7Y4L7R9_9BURK|nr:TonB-dependent siderophore receptor [Pelistega europaea]NOL48545.1 TonB-dependent siderophore receptor [Pelistega europaea]